MLGKSKIFIIFLIVLGFYFIIIYPAMLVTSRLNNLPEPSPPLGLSGDYNFEESLGVESFYEEYQNKQILQKEDFRPSKESEPILEVLPTEEFLTLPRSFEIDLEDSVFVPEPRKGEASKEYFRSLNLTEDEIYVIMQFDSISGNPSDEQLNISLRCRAIDIQGSNTYSAYYSPAMNLTIARPQFDLRNLSVVYQNITQRIFSFSVNNTFNSAINVSWDINFGPVNKTSQYNESLSRGEDMLVYIYYNYASSGNYLVTARVWGPNQVYDTEVLNITV